jgi:hypothetical protein
MSDFDIAADVELGSRVSAEAQWEQAKRDIPRHDAEFDAAQAAKVCPACALALRTNSRLYHVSCRGAGECSCTHDDLTAVLFRGGA